MNLPTTKRMPSKTVHSIGLVLFICVLAFLTFTKGWLVFFFFPVLLVLSPLLFVTQIWTNNVCNRQEDWAIRRQLITLAQWQLFAMFWAFFIAPGLWDTPEMLALFGTIHVPNNAIWATITITLTIISFAVFFVITVRQCIVLTRIHRQHRLAARR